jgi:hypothetical protein
MELLPGRLGMIFLAMGWSEDIYHMACHLVALHSTGVSKQLSRTPYYAYIS